MADARKHMEHGVSSEQIVARAIEVAGSDDFGADGWQEGLARSLAGFARVPMTQEALATQHGKLVHDLVMRLKIEQWYQDHPETADEQLDGQVFVVGLPRTGTTAMVGMMALDERFRFLRAWEGASPIPPPVAGEEDTDPRVVAARGAVDYTMAHMHIRDVDGPEEDLAILAGFDMKSYHGVLPMPDDYVAWWLHADFTSFYALHERLLKLLQSRRKPGLWLLKSPPHLFRLKEIAARYPKARFVMTHRDPRKVIASVASLHSALHEERCLPGTIDRKAVGPRHLAIWAEGMRRALAARAEIGEHRFVDVRNDEVVQRPIETFERIYDHLGMDLNPALRARLDDYNSRNAPGNFGAHRYTAEEYGLTDASIRAEFKDYVERFAL